MADEKKPKIDLKARLGKKTVSAPGASPGAVPPPVGIPKPVGVPVPPFAGGQASAPKTAPAKVDASDPYAAITEEAAPKKQEKAIKVEMSEEVVRAQKKGRGRVIALAVFTAVVGIVLGFAIGSGVERGKGADKALSGAQDLVKDVDTANAEAEKLAEVLKQAGLKLSDNKYPSEEVTALGGIRIPFEGANLVGKGIGRFNAKTAAALFKYASAVQAANDQKEKLNTVLSLSKKGIEDFLQQKKEPKVRWSVYVVGSANGPWAVMQPLPKPFLVKSDKKEKDKDGKEKKYKWPGEFKIKDGGREHTLKRYTGGACDRDNKIIPVDPGTQSSVCPSDVLVSLRRELRGMQEILSGTKGPTPDSERPGLIDLGSQVVELLKGIGTPQ